MWRGSKRLSRISSEHDGLQSTLVARFNKMIRKITETLAEEGVKTLSTRAQKYLKDEAPVTSTGYHRLRNTYFELYRRRHKIPRQYRRIQRLVERDEFVLVVLDACRYDYFTEYISEYLDGDLSKTWSSGNRTPRWIPATWDDEYEGVTYVNSSVVVSDIHFKLRGRDYRPSDHFGEISHVWANQWDPELFTVTPEAMTDAALQVVGGSDETRVVVHYFQPHAPYVGDPTITGWRGDQQRRVTGNESREELLESASTVSLADIRALDIEKDDIEAYGLETTRHPIGQQASDGVISDEELRRAYVGNLHAVLESVARLVTHLDVPTVVTADHGEFLGEHGLYMHPNTTHPLLREVPWFEVAQSELAGKPIPDDIGTSPDTAAVSQQVVEDRLEGLGYL